jgi:hypothetical protein
VTGERKKKGFFSNKSSNFIALKKGCFEINKNNSTQNKMVEEIPS